MTHRLALSPIRGRGTSLIEVLIALTLVAVTMLGLLGLQLRSMGMQKDSLDRRAAAMIVAGFGERISANYAGFELPANSYSGLQMAGTISPPGTAAFLGCGTPAACTPAEIVARDWVQLQNDVSVRLPGGLAFTLVPTAGGAALNTGVQVTLAWTDVQRTQANQPGAIVIGTDQACSDAFNGNVPNVITADNSYRCYSAYVYP